MRQKFDYIRKVNLTNILDPSKDKENINLEFIVNELQRKKEKEKETIGRPKISAYQDLSPNLLGDYIALMTNKKERVLNMW